MSKVNTAVLISGSGTNLQAIIDKWKEGSTYDLKLVISNEPDAYGLERAKAAGIATLVINHRSYGDREHFEQAIHGMLLQKKVELVALAGFMRLLSPWFMELWHGKVVNIHPALLPAFRGLHTHRRALQAGVRYSGCTVHFVDEGVDTGQIINQAMVEVLPEDTPETLAQRILVKEHQLYPQTLEEVAAGKITLAALLERARKHEA